MEEKDAKAIERQELMTKLDKDLESYIAEKVRDAEQKPNAEDRSYLNLSPDEFAAELKKHPFFMTDFDPSQPMSPEMEGLQALKYQSDSADDNADSFKDDGNRSFRLSQYRFAVDNYTAGIKCKPESKDLMAILYSNRAAARFRIGNYRSGLVDCVFARRYKPDHKKAIVKGIQCCMEMHNYSDAIRWCDAALILEPENAEFIATRKKAEKGKREAERDQRREELRLRKLREKKKSLYKAIEDRGVRLDKKFLCDEEDEEDTDIRPEMEKVCIDAEGVMHWPVLFLYPEHAQSDSIEAFNENSVLADHIQHMFNPAEQIPWDLDHNYLPKNLDVYFEDRDKEVLYRVPTNLPLKKILQHKRYVVYQGSPSFILLSRSSDFNAKFLAKYNVLSF